MVGEGLGLELTAGASPFLVISVTSTPPIHLTPMQRRVLLAVALATVVPGQAADALASGAVPPTPSGDRYHPTLVFTYPAPTVVSDPATQVSVTRVSSGAAVPFTVSGSGTTQITIAVDATLASGAQYAASVTPDGDTADTVQWTTRQEPAHPKLRAKIVTAVPAAAVDDILHRLDRANLLAVPRDADVVDISAASGHALTAADLSGCQAALVVTDEDVFDQAAAGTVLSAYAAKGHGVVVAGQTHWPNAGAWGNSSIGDGSGSWAGNWSPLAFAAPASVEGGTLNTGGMAQHFLTHGLGPFTVHGPGSGMEATHNSWNEAVLAHLHTTAAYSHGGQSFIAIHWESSAQPGRVVDLGFDPWSTDAAADGGYDASEAGAAGALLARALWWATDRIAPTDTHFTSKPKNPSPYRTVAFSMAGRDADPASVFSQLRFQYRVNKGRWKWAAGSTSFGLYHLPAGHTYTVRARAVDFAGNKDVHPAVYRFRVPAGATG